MSTIFKASRLIAHVGTTDFFIHNNKNDFNKGLLGFEE